MVIKDEYSRFLLVEIIHSLKAETVTKRLDTIFSIFGIPEETRTDNGPPFNSLNFKEFSEYLGFRKITPLWPKANGIAESFMKNLGKIIRKRKR